VFENLLKALEKKTEFATVKGLVWKENGQVISNENERLIEDMDELPFPARHLFQLDRYHPSAQIRGRHVFHIITSRGCPYRCGYCSCHKTFGRTYRFMSAPRVLKEIRCLIKEYKADSLHFYDDTLTIHRGRIMELCDLMISSKLTLPWACFTRVDRVDRELLENMKRAGCYQIFYGVESATQRLLDIIDKDITLEQIRHAFKITKEEGIEALGSFIIGLPTETLAESQKTIDFAIEIDADFAHCEVLTPHPGTRLFETAMKHGQLVTTDWNRFSTWSEEPVYLPHGRTLDELKQTKKMFYRRFYMRPMFLLKRLFKLLKLPPGRILKLVQSGLSISFR
ncbi:radical SAM protein, partial [bacterium]|nr:radical SAM protein [bacterium]